MPTQWYRHGRPLYRATTAHTAKRRPRIRWPYEDATHCMIWLSASCIAIIVMFLTSESATLWCAQTRPSPDTPLTQLLNHNTITNFTTTPNISTRLRRRTRLRTRVADEHIAEDKERQGLAGGKEISVARCWIRILRVLEELDAEQFARFDTAEHTAAFVATEQPLYSVARSSRGRYLHGDSSAAHRCPRAQGGVGRRKPQFNTSYLTTSAVRSLKTAALPRGDDRPSQGFSQVSAQTRLCDLREQRQLPTLTGSLFAVFSKLEAAEEHRLVLWPARPAARTAGDDEEHLHVQAYERSASRIGATTISSAVCWRRSMTSSPGIRRSETSRNHTRSPRAAAGHPTERTGYEQQSEY
ncbi:hypothetical protein FB567DRAFT_552931 [Paraphoma chrysanthemicola]|uniref:Uncharacterized protein n=1 Tax=Paraphoma chrysanthemicola TaxID=798071 RepID=A0A8K0QZK5_9PLEO|nr:hypothetical protein FB567DRAFT_552931 [Paraphoma chrysanthemicola]